MTRHTLGTVDPELEACDWAGSGQANSQGVSPCGIVHDAYLQLPSQPFTCWIRSITRGQPSQLSICCVGVDFIGSQIWRSRRTGLIDFIKSI